MLQRPALTIAALRSTSKAAMSTSAASRWYFVDALRICAFALLVPYHVGMYYVSWGWHVKAAELVPAFEPVMAMTYPWRMSLLFLVSGTAFALMLQSARGQQPWLLARLKRLGLPLLFGMAVVVPPQPYFEVVQKFGYRGDYLDFLGLYFSGHGGFCKAGGGCLVLPTWNHLWFLAYLIAYTLLLALLLRRWRDLPQRLAAGLEGLATRRLGGLALLAVPVLYLLLTRLALRDRFPITHALFDDPYAHSQFLAFFLLGLALAHLPAVWRRFESLRWWALGLALSAWATLMLAEPGRGLPGSLLISVQQWFAVVAACGFAHRHLNRDSAWRRYLTDAILPLYLLHQTVIIVAAVALRPLALPAAIEAPLLVVLAVGLSLAAYAGVKHVAWLRPAFGLAQRESAAPVSTAKSAAPWPANPR